MALSALGGFLSLAVDFGAVVTARLELQRAADAAALAAADEVYSGGIANANAQALTYARANSVNGESLPTHAVEVQFLGRVNRVLTENALPTEGVRVTVRRSHACGNPVPLFFARFFGLSAIDVHARAVAGVRKPAPTYNLVGIDRASFSSLGVLAEINGRFVSNGAISVGMPLGLLVRVDGDARSFGNTTRRGVLASVSGSVAPLPDELEYESVSLPPRHDNTRIASHLDSHGNFNALLAVDIPAGVYVVRDLNFLAGLIVNLQGPVTFYVTGDFNLGAAVNLLGQNNPNPAMFKVRVLPGGTVNFLAPVLAPLNMDLYAPDSDIRIAVSVTAYRGRLIGRTLDIALPAIGRFTEDRSLQDALADLPAVRLIGH